MVIAFSYLTEDNQLQVLTVPPSLALEVIFLLIFYEEVELRCQRSRCTLLSAVPFYLGYSNLGQTEGTEGENNFSTSSCHHLLPATILSKGERNTSPGVCWASGHSSNPHPAPLLKNQRKEGRFQTRGTVLAKHSLKATEIVLDCTIIWHFITFKCLNLQLY